MCEATTPYAICGCHLAFDMILMTKSDAPNLRQILGFLFSGWQIAFPNSQPLLSKTNTFDQPHLNAIHTVKHTKTAHIHCNYKNGVHVCECSSEKHETMLLFVNIAMCLVGLQPIISTTLSLIVNIVE